jgi:RNA polymerase sigma factor (sigma-70 family)
MWLVKEPSAMKLVRNIAGRQAADDLLQIAAAKILKYPKEVDDAESRQHAWAKEIARNTAHDHCRRSAVRRKHIRSLEIEVQMNSGSFVSREASPIENAIRTLDPDPVKEALQRIPPAERELIESNLGLNGAAPLNLTAIARQRNRSVAAIHTRFWKAIGSLRNELGADESVDPSSSPTSGKSE